MDHTTEGSAIGDAVAAHVLFAPLTTALMAPPAAALSVFRYAHHVEKVTHKVFVRVAHWFTVYAVRCTLFAVHTSFHHLSSTTDTHMFIFPSIINLFCKPSRVVDALESQAGALAGLGSGAQASEVAQVLQVRVKKECISFTFSVLEYKLVAKLTFTLEMNEISPRSR